MKRILFSAYNLDLGGIETSLITLINFLLARGYEVSLALEKREGFFLDKISPNVEIIEYTPADDSNFLVRKIKNLIKKIKFVLKYKNKFDFSASFATYSIPASFIARTCAKNNALWGHADYLSLYGGNEKEMKKFFKKRKCNKFKNIIFVSEEGKNSFIKAFPRLQNKVSVCNNLINDKRIINQSKEEIYDLKKENVITFLNVGRHDEKQKKLSLALRVWKIIERDPRLNDWKLTIVGHGEEYASFYKNFIQRENLQRVTMEGAQNPVRYYNRASLFMFTSAYEGWGLTLTEAQQFGVVPVAFDSYSSLTDIITDGENGFAIPNGDIESFARKLATLMLNVEMRKEMAFKAIESSKRFTADKICKDWVNLFQSLDAM